MAGSNGVRVRKDPGGTTNGRKLYVESKGQVYNPEGYRLTSQRGQEPNHFTDEEKNEPVALCVKQVAEHLFTLLQEEVEKAKQALVCGVIATEPLRKRKADK